MTMQTVTSVEAQNNFGKLMNTIPREPVTITKHGKKYAMLIAYDQPVEFGETNISQLSLETQKMYQKNIKKDKSAFLSF